MLKVFNTKHNCFRFQMNKRFDSINKQCSVDGNAPFGNICLHSCDFANDNELLKFVFQSKNLNPH